MVIVKDLTILEKKLTESFILKGSLIVWKFSASTGRPKEECPALESFEDFLEVSIPFSCLFCLDSMLKLGNYNSIMWTLDTLSCCDNCTVKGRIPSFSGGVVEFCDSAGSAVNAYQHSREPEKIKKYAEFIVLELEQLLKEKNGGEDSL